MEGYSYKSSNANECDLDCIELENEKCLTENRVLRSKLQLVKQNSSLRVATILAEVLTWIDESTSAATCTRSEKTSSYQRKQIDFPKPWSDNDRTSASPDVTRKLKATAKSQGIPHLNPEKIRETPSPKKALFQYESSNNTVFQPLIAQPQTPWTKAGDNNTKNGYSSPENISSKFAKSHASPTNVTEEADFAGKASLRERRGSLIYDTGDIKLNVQQSEGFKPIVEIPAEQLQTQRSTTPDSTTGDSSRNHGHVWNKNEAIPSPLATSTPYVSTRIKENVFDNRNIRHQRSPSTSPVRFLNESYKEKRKSSPSGNKSLRKTTEKTTTRPRSPKPSLMYTKDEPKSAPKKYENFSSNASTQERGRSVTPSSRKIRSPFMGTPDKLSDYNETSGFYSSGPDDVSINGVKVKPTTRLLGEISFQLDRKILNYVFRTSEKKRRFYGYIIRNIPEKIKRESMLDERTGLVDVQKKQILEYRYQYILNTLRPLGYRIDFHPDFCADMVNKYGLLPLPPDRNSSDGIMPDQKELVMETITRIAPAEELHDLSILLESLTLLAKGDSSAIISF